MDGDAVLGHLMAVSMNEVRGDMHYTYHENCGCCMIFVTDKGKGNETWSDY